NHAVRFNNQLPITYAGTQSLTVKGGRGASTFDVWSTTAATPVFLDAGPGSNAFIVGVPFTGGSEILDLIQGPLSVQGAGGSGKAAVSVIDSGSRSGHTYTLSSDTLTRTGAAPIRFANVQALAIT